MIPDTREEVRTHGEEESRQRQKVLSLADQRTLYELARKVKGTYGQFMQLLKDLDIPRP